MNPKIFLLIGFLAVALVFMGVPVIMPSGFIYTIAKIIMFVIAVFFVVLAFASRYYASLIVPVLFKKRKGLVVMNTEKPYSIATTEDCIIRKEGSNFIATAYIDIPIYVSASEMSDEEKFRFANQVSRLVGLSKEPVRFSSELYLMNKDEYIGKLKDNINQAESEVAKLMDSKGQEARLEHTKGKLSMWRKMLDNVSNATSFELGTFASISAKGVKEFEAITIVRQKAVELMNGIASALGVTPSIVTGNDILKYIEPEFLIPYTTITEQINKNIQRQVS